MDAANPLLRLWRWLRAGYPADAPRHGYIALLAVLPRTLTDADIRQITDALIDQALRTGQPVTPSDITVMIRRTALQAATVEDSARTTAQLAARGWAVATPPADSPNPRPGTQPADRIGPRCTGQPRRLPRTPLHSRVEDR